MLWLKEEHEEKVNNFLFDVSNNFFIRFFSTNKLPTIKVEINEKVYVNG